MAFAMIDDLTGDHHPMDAAHRLVLVLDPDGDNDGTIAVWDVASTDPKELLAQLGEHLSGVAAPLTPDRGPLPGVEQLRQALGGARTLGQPVQVEPLAVVPDPDAQPDDPDVIDPPSAVPAPRPAPRPSATERVAEAVGGAATDAVIRAWAAKHNVPCSMTGKLNAWARAGYLRLQGGTPDQQLWDDYRAAIKPSPSAAADVEKPAAARPVPPAGRAAAGTPTPGRAGRGPDGPPAPAPGGEGGSGAGATQDDDVRPEQRDLAEELAAGGSTPKEIVEKTGVPLALARRLVMGGKR